MLLSIGFAKQLDWGSSRTTKTGYKTWKAYGIDAGSILLTILPFLKIKKERAKLGILFLKLHRNSFLKENIRNKIMKLNHNAENKCPLRKNIKK